MIDSTTKHQHFIAQIDQRLNAINPNAKPEHQRIYEFAIVDRDRHEVRLTSANGKSIASTLSMFDLFLFDVDKERASRANLENVFERYESQMRANTESLLRAHAARSSAVGQEVLDLFIAKMVNFIRNPYSVTKVLDTFGPVAQIHPTDPAIYAAYERVITGRKPQQAYLCGTLCISDDQYRTWLRLLFMLLTPLAEGGRSLFEDALQSLFIERNHALHVHVHTYQTQRCLLSDRGVSSPIPQDKHLAFDFNLCCRAFIRYAFLDYEAVLGRPLPEGIRRGLSLGPKQIQVSYLIDDLQALDIFHRRVIEQSYARVFCSGESPHGVTVLTSA